MKRLELLTPKDPSTKGENMTNLVNSEKRFLVKLRNDTEFEQAELQEAFETRMSSDVKIDAMILEQKSKIDKCSTKIAQINEILKEYYA